MKTKLFARRLGLLIACCVTSVVESHDFWVQPNQFWLNPEVRTPLTLQVGHGPYRQRSPIPLNRITRFDAIAPDGAVIDLRSSLQLSDGTEDGTFRFINPGAYVLVLQTDDRAQSHLPAIRFNDYLKVEGLTPALKERERTHRTNADGSEIYSRQAKSIVQVGTPSKESQAEVTKSLGLPLEIVLEQSPYMVPQPSNLPVRVMYQGLPLAGALVKLTNLEHDAAPIDMQLTDQAGRARFVMPSEGTWLLSVIWTRPLPASRETDFETVFSSLSFGFPTMGFR